jgi:GNAT superfamily N-acetyltransferase
MSHIKVFTPTWRPATADDLSTIDHIADRIHTGLPERPEVFAEKRRLFPRGCRALQLDGKVIGYGFAHPWMLFDVPSLDTFLEKLPANADCLYLHDVVVLPEYRGQGATAYFVKLMEAEAYGLGIQTLALVSVYETHPMWAKYGFAIVETTALSAKLESYGPTAKYMVSRRSG